MTVHTWKLQYLLPDFQMERAFETEFLVLVPHDDSRLASAVAANPGLAKLVEGFRDHHDNLVWPFVLLCRDDAPDSVWSFEAFSAFRNILAISSIALGRQRAHSDPNNNVINTLWSDYFDFHPIYLSADEKGLVVNSPAKLGWMDFDSFRGYTNPALPSHVKAETEPSLLSAGVRLWDQHFVQKRDEWKTRVLFRSLEMAYLAASMPTSSLSSLYDYGSRIALWVSAFEILSHPGGDGSTGLDSVLALLVKPQVSSSRIRARRFRHRWRNEPRRVNLPQRLYVEMYKARNDFIHGNPVDLERLFPFKKKKRPNLVEIAPLVYQLAIEEFFTAIEVMEPAPVPSPTSSFIQRSSRSHCLEKALLRSLLDEGDWLSYCYPNWPLSRRRRARPGKS